MSPNRERERERELERQRRRASNDRRQVPLAVVLISMLVGGLCALLALNTASAALEVRNRSLTDANTNASDAEQQLMRDLADKQAPASLQAAATALGLVPNRNPAFLRLNADGSVSILGSPTPASAPPAPVTPTPTPSTKPAPRPSATTTGKPVPAVTVTVTAAPRLTATAHPVATPTASPTRPAPRPTSTPTGGH